MTVIRLDQRTSKPPDFATMASNKKSHLEAMKELLAHPEINVNQADSDGWTSIIMAFFYGHAKVVTVLLAHPQICINQADTDGWTPLLRASQKGHVKVVEGLLADPYINVNKAHNDSGATPLFIASLSGHLDVVRKLLAHPEINHCAFLSAGKVTVKSEYTAHSFIEWILICHKN